MRSTEKLKEIITAWESAEIVATYIKSRAMIEAPLNILEAGCGSHWWINLGDTPYVLTGLDIDKHALEIRKNLHQDLHEIIEGDLRSTNLPDNKFDVIYCAFVLEHIKEVDVVLKNFLKWLKPGGIAVLRFPDPYSVQGFITRSTPHKFHLWVYKHLYGWSDAGKPGNPPYPTFYSDLLSRQGIDQFCGQHGFTVIGEYKEEVWYPTKIKQFLFTTFTKLVGILSLGILDGRYGNVMYILEKQ